MSEGFPDVPAERDKGLELQGADLANPEYRPKIERVREIRNKVYAQPDNQELSDAFVDFARTLASDVRLRHYFVGSGPFGFTEVFDGEGDEAVFPKIEAFAQKWNL